LRASVGSTDASASLLARVGVVGPTRARLLLVGRGLATGRPTLFVLDGSKALRAAVTRAWGKGAVIQRCQVHKMRNLKAHVSERHWHGLARRLSEAYQETDYATAKASLEGTARWLERLNADAAASLREGLEETLTVVRLGVPGALRRTLATTNPIESALSVTRRVTARVKRWRDGDMRRRWCVAGMLRAEGKFRRVKGHRAMPALLKALEAVVRGDRVESGVPLRENVRRNGTFAPLTETPPCQRERL
jgi:transposase-like protein